MPDISVHGSVLFQRGICYLDEREMLVGQRDQGGDVWRVQTAPTMAGPWQTVAPRGASVVTAGNGRWLGFLPGTGVFSVNGLIGAGMSLAADVQACRGKAAPDGTIGLLLDYQAGQGLRLLALDGTSVDIPDAQPLGQVAVVDRTRALWADRRGGVRTCGGLPVPVTLPGPVLWPSVMQLAGAWWILYHSTDDNGLVLHPFDSLTGYRLTKPPAFYPLGLATSATRVIVAWANNPADSAGSSRSIDITESRIDLRPAPAHADAPAHTDVPHTDIPQEPSVMNLPDQVRQSILRYAAAFPVPQAQGPDDLDPKTGGASDTFENKARVWSFGLAEQVQFDTQDPRWGVKNAGGGRPQSKDSIAFNADHLYNFDVLSGVGTGKPSLSIPTTAAIIDGQQFMPVKPVDHVGGGVQQPPSNPPSTPPADPNDAALSLRVAALEAALEHVLASLESDDARLRTLEAVKLPDLSGLARRGDRVTVTVEGKVSFFGVNRWGGTGTIDIDKEQQ